MRRHISLFVVSVVLVLTAAPQFARAETSGTAPATQAASTSVCGKTVEDKLAAARQALQSTDDKATRAALTCLIEAVGALQTGKQQKIPFIYPPPTAGGAH